MKWRGILGSIWVSFICLSVALAQTDGRHAVNVTGANLGLTSDEIVYLADKLPGTGVKWAFLGVIWNWSAHGPPSDRPQGPHSYFGPQVQQYHNYEFTYLDQWVSELQARNINIVIGLNTHPTWVGGQSCSGPGGDARCGIIYSSYKQW